MTVDLFASAFLHTLSRPGHLFMNTGVTTIVCVNLCQCFMLQSTFIPFLFMAENLWC